MSIYGGNFVKLGLPEVVNWVNNKCDKITDSDVSNALRTGYLTKSINLMIAISRDMKDSDQ